MTFKDFANCDVFASKTEGIFYAVKEGVKYYFRKSEAQKADDNANIITEPLEGGGFWLTFTAAPVSKGLKF